MVELLCRPICQMGIFMICGQAVLLLRPNQEYEKYIKLLLSLLLLVQMLYFLQNFVDTSLLEIGEQGFFDDRDYYKGMEQAFRKRFEDSYQKGIADSVLASQSMETEKQ